jgi:hypothetical protein
VAMLGKGEIYVGAEELQFAFWYLRTGVHRIKTQNKNIFIFTAVRTSDRTMVSWIWSSHGGEYEGGCLLGCSAVWTGRSLPTFRKFLPPSSLGRWVSAKTAVFSPCSLLPLDTILSVLSSSHPSVDLFSDAVRTLWARITEW